MKLSNAILFVSLSCLASCTVPRNTWLRATKPGTQQRSGEIVLDLRTDKPEYKIGDPITATLTASRRCRVEVWSEDAKGQRTAVWPRPGGKPLPLSPGQTLTLPPRGADWRLIAAKPTGTNTLVAVAQEVAAVTTIQRQEQPAYFQMHTGGWKSDRGVTVVPASSSASRPSGGRRTGEVRWLYRVK